MAGKAPAESESLSGIVDKFSTDWVYQFSLIGITLALYIITKNSLFGVLVLLELLFIVALEIRHGVRKHGWKAELRDIAISLGAILLLWFAAMFVMGTSVPLNAVVSCSMLPNIERGDMVLVQGSQPAGYEVEISQQEFAQLNGSPTVYPPDGSTRLLRGSLYTYCAQFPTDATCRQFFADPASFHEARGPFSFQYGKCTRENREGRFSYQTPCLEYVEFNGTKYYPDLSHDTIVYGPAQGDLYSLAGDIIHRVYFTVHVGDSTFYLTKGDNNPVMDIQEYSYSMEMGNSPPGQAQYKGKVVGRVPFIGYLKLFTAGFFSETTNCDSTLATPMPR
ncbi:MAG: hypothetical protein PHQ80_04375 [Candidatus ainarchaeum sp.]|nr:hypothetical protein [Candidatus ainarchaeum sp.]MDD5096470.1 hypothetical protein [Candidatus ainarchaeum sp.]